jgi:hypothetical protein
MSYSKRDRVIRSDRLPRFTLGVIGDRPLRGQLLGHQKKFRLPILDGLGIC